MKTVNPMSVKETKEDIQTVLRVLAGGNNCDGSPYDQMQIAADYIDNLEAVGSNIVPIIDKMKPLLLKIEYADAKILLECIETLKVIAACFYMYKSVEV